MSRCFSITFSAVILFASSHVQAQEAMDLAPLLHVENQTFRTVTLQVSYATRALGSKPSQPLTFSEKKTVNNGQTASWKLGSGQYIASKVIDELDVRKPTLWQVRIVATDQAGNTKTWGGLEPGQGVRLQSSSTSGNGAWQPHYKVVITAD